MWCKRAVYLSFCLAACTDTNEAKVNPAAVSVPDALLDQARADGHSHWNRFSTEQKRAAIRTIERVYAGHGEVFLRPRIAFIDGVLPGDAAAVVIRDPGSPGEPIIAVSRSGGEPRALWLGQVALRDDATHVPVLATRRVLHVARNGEVAVVGAQSEQPWRVSLSNQLPLDGIDVSGRLIHSASSVSVIAIPGIGAGILLQFE